MPLALALGYDSITGAAIPFVGSAAGFAEQDASHALGVVDPAVEAHRHRLRPGHDSGFDEFTWFERLLASGQSPGYEQMHPFAKHARRHPELARRFDRSGAIAGLLGQFPGGGRQRRFVAVERAGREFQERLPHGHPQHLHQTDGVIGDHRHHHDGARMNDHLPVSQAAVTAGLLDPLHAKPLGGEQQRRSVVVVGGIVSRWIKGLPGSRHECPSGAGVEGACSAAPATVTTLADAPPI